MTTRKYSSRSQQTTLTAALSSSGTSATVVSGSALLGGVTISAGETFTVVIDPDTALEEIVDVTAVSTNTLTITRGVDGSSGQAHSAGAVVRHMAIGRDYREANTHIENTTTAHGLTIANVLETTDTNMITTAMLQASAVTTAKIADSNVTTAKIADSAITSAKIADLTIATGDIADSAITSGKIATGAVGTAKIDDLSVTTAKIADSAITSAKIADLTIATGDIADSAITSAKIADGTIVNADVNTSAQIAYGKLNLTNSIVNADVNASAAIDKTKISGTAITAADTGTVTSTMIADGTIVNADINASAAIDWTKIAPSATVSSTELGYLDGVTSAIQTQIDSKLGTSTAASTYAPLASPALTGTPTAPTATAGTNTTQVATTAFVKTAVDNVVAAAPGALDTLNELAAALGNDASFSTTVTNNLATKLPLAGGTMSGAIAMGTNKITGLGTPTVSGDAATKDYADTKLALSGGTMTGAIAMGTNKITGVGTPTTSTDAATKGYVDTAVIAPSNLTGPITSVGNATAIASQTGTGTKFVVDQSPTIVTPTLSGNTTAGTINNTTIPSSKTLVATDSTQYVVPSQTGNSGKYLTTDGTTSSWGAISGSLAQPTEPSSPTDGLIWVDTDGTAPTTVVTRWQKTGLAAGTTSLSGNDDNSVPLLYTAGYEQVFLNGALLSRGNDYTATSGTSITLTTGIVSGDIVEVVCATQIATTDTYTQSAADAKFISKSLTTTTGDIIYASSANTPARLGIGSTSQVLTVSGGLPTWATPSSGGMTQITSGTVTNGTLSVASISGSYNHLELWIYNYKGSNNSVPSFRFNDDNTSKYPGTDTAMYINNTAGNSGYYAIGGSLTNSEATGQIILSIPWYASSNVHKNCTYTFAGKNGTNTANGSAGIGIFTVLNLGAINKITTPFDNQGGTSMSFSWELWGIK